MDNSVSLCDTSFNSVDIENLPTTNPFNEKVGRSQSKQSRFIKSKTFQYDIVPDSPQAPRARKLNTKLSKSIPKRAMRAITRGISSLMESDDNISTSSYKLMQD